MTDKILLVEDDAPIVQALVYKLEKEGLVTDVAGDGVVGLEHLKNNGPFSLVLLDLRMPKGDGLDFLEDKQKDSSVRDVPVMVLTNLPSRNIMSELVSLG